MLQLINCRKYLSENRFNGEKMERNIVISVIVPVYNVACYLPECVESILGQSFRDFELILVDDGSTDSSGELCDQYRLKDSRIQVIHKINGGLSSARNAGIDAASGNFIAFVDSDDFVHEEYLSVLYKMAEEYNADLTACSFVKGKTCEWPKNTDAVEIRNGREIMENMNDRDVIITVAWNKLYKSSLFKENKLRFPEGKLHEDMFLMPQILWHAEKMIITDRKLYFYRQRSGSIMNSSFSLKNFDILDAVEFRMGYLKEKGLSRLYKDECESYVRKCFQIKSRLNNAEDRKNYIKILQERVGSVVWNRNVISILSWKYKLKLLYLMISILT